MKVLVKETCAGSNFAFRTGEVVESSDDAIIEVLKELVRAEIATEIKGEKVERAVRNTDLVEKR